MQNEDDMAYQQTFGEFLGRGLTLSNQQIAALGEEAELSDDHRRRALNLLDYAFKRQTAWEQSYQLLQRLAPKMERAGARDQWIPYLEQGFAASRHHAESKAEAEFALWIGQLYRLRSNFGLADAWLTRSADQFAESNEPNGRARALNQLAYVAWSQHANDRAIALAEEALTLLDEADLERAMSLSALGLVAIDRQQWQTAEAYHRQALLLRKTHHQSRQIGWSLQNLAYAVRGQGHWETAIVYFLEAIALLDQAHDPANRAIAQMNLGVTYSLRGESAKALAAYASAAATLRAVGDEYNLAKVLVNQGIEYMNLRDWQQAEQHFLAASNLFKAQKIQGEYLNALDGLGICYLEQGRYAEALPLFEEVATHLESIKDTRPYPGLISKIEEQLQRARAGVRGNDGSNGQDD
jgi:tetratricopeptide (TPR) repeat protein